MASPTQGWRRGATTLMGVAVLSSALAGCSGSGGPDTGSEFRASRAAPLPPSQGATTAPTTTERSNPTRQVSCDVHTCTLTLTTTDPRDINAFGASLRLDGIERGTASLTVGDAAVECTANESVHAGPLTLFCDDVTTDSVTLTAEVG